MNKRSKRVLVVDDDEILRNGMRLILEADNHLVEEAANGKEALVVMKTHAFDMIISDCEMPEMDGLQLLSHVRARNENILFILISDFSVALQSRQAVQLGASGFLNKPFTKADFNEVVDAAFTKLAAENDSVEMEYIQVPIVEFVTGTKLTVDLFLQISEKKFLKIAHKGGNIDQAQIEGYLKKGLNWLYMRKQDFALYVGFNITIAQKVHSAGQIECARKIRLTMHVTENLISQLRRTGLNRQQLEETSNVVMNAVALIQTSPDALKLLESMEEGGALPAHSIAVSIWACLIAKQMGWSGHSTFFRIALCTLFHDVGLKELDDSLVNKPRFEMNRQEIKAFEAHTLRGRDILQSVPGMLTEVVTVAVQHHELYRGGGYPYGLKMQQIHPLASLTSLADRLCETLKFSERDVGIAAAFEQLSHSSRDFDPAYFRALGEIVKKAIAKSEPIPTRASPDRQKVS